ncbi:MAG: hypothetical protein ABIY70_14935 [Capsulimonas sp.]|uniref:hypothetical protein n=1 Tax=Capsulimonas sp. TaxID=2494211 RepID=UPI0032647D37
MEIYPQDLSVRMYRKLLSKRSDGVFSEADIDQACEFLVQWQSLPEGDRKAFPPSLLKMWSRKKSRTRKIVSYSLIAAGALSLPLWSHNLGAVTLAPFCFFALGLLPRAEGNSSYVATMVQYGHKPITEREVSAVMPFAQRLCSSYWGLLNATRQAANISDEVRKNVRTALDVIDEALDQCSAMTADNVTAESPEALMQQADEVDREADTEKDGVSAASLRRQASALRTSAEMSIRLATIRRRGEVLEREIGAQIQAMHVSLTQYQQSGHQSGEELLTLARNIQQVADAAAANADAQDEVRAAIAPTYEPALMQSLKQ